MHAEPVLPGFTVVVPTRERPAALRRCLAALARLDYPGDRLEVVVVRDGEAAPTDAVVRGFASHLDCRVLAGTGEGPGAARNVGAGAARHDLLAFTDDDCEPAADWLHALAGALAREPAALVGGPNACGEPGDGPFARGSWLLLDFLHADAVRRGGAFLVGNNLAAGREGFEALGGFATFPRAAGEDLDLCERWEAAGWPLVFEPSALVGHRFAPTGRGFVAQHFRYGRGCSDLRAARTAQGRRTAGRSALGYGLGVLSHPFATRPRPPLTRPLRDLGVIGLAHAAYGAGFLWQESRRRPG